MDESENTIKYWSKTLIGPVLSLVAFILTYLFDPLNFGSQQPLSAIPAFFLSIIILIINQNIHTNSELKKATLYSDRIYEAVKNYLHVTPIGSPEKAMQYIISRIQSLREVNNTSFNLVDEKERADEKFYETDTYDDGIKKIAENANKNLIWKDVGDKFAILRFRTIYSLNKKLLKNDRSGYKYKLISHDEPQMNFIILEYKDGNREVLFNWDFRGSGQDPIVLISRDHLIIEMFAIQYNQLWRYASNDHDNSAIKSASIK